MTDSLANLRTKQSLLNALKDASSHKLTHEEISEQRVSFIASVVAKSEDSDACTRTKIREVLARQAGEEV